MKAEDVPNLLEQSDALLKNLLAIDAVLGAIAAKFNALPNEGDLSDYATAVGSISADLERANELWSDGALPNEDVLKDYASAAGEIATSLEQANEAWEALPSKDDLATYARSAETL